MTDALTNTNSLPALTDDQQIDYILLDGSSSMQSKWWDMLAAIDAYVAPLKADGVNSFVTLSIFDSGELDQVVRHAPLADWVSVVESQIGAYWGMTPLYDAINVMSQKAREVKGSPDRKKRAVIVTDGEENDSKFTDLTTAKSLLDWMRAEGWQITFLGCDFNNAKQAALLGADEGSSIGVQQRLLRDAAASLAEKSKLHAKYGKDVHFSKDEQTQFGGSLVDHRSEAEKNGGTH